MPNYEKIREQNLARIHDKVAPDNLFYQFDTISIASRLRGQMIQMVFESGITHPGEIVDMYTVSEASLPDDVKIFFQDLTKNGFQIYAYPHYTKDSAHSPIIEINARKGLHREGGLSVSIANNLAVRIDAFYAGKNSLMKIESEQWRSGQNFDIDRQLKLVGGVLDVATNAVMKKFNIPPVVEEMVVIKS